MASAFLFFWVHAVVVVTALLGLRSFLFATTGQATGLVFAGFSAFAVVGGALLSGRREPVNLNDPVRFRQPTGGGGVRGFRVAIGNRVLPRWQWLWHGTWANRVYQELEERNKRHTSALKLEQRVRQSLASSREGLFVWLGFSGTDEVELDLANEGAHALIVGATGAGKSQLLTCWLVSLAQKFAPNQLEFWLLDFKGGATLSDLSTTPWCSRFATDLDTGANSAEQLLAALSEELVSRLRLCTEHCVSRVDDLALELRPPRIVLAVDEAQHLLANPLTHAPLTDLAARGRSLGIHVVLAAQSLSGIPRGLLTNLGVRIAVGRADPVDLAQLGFQRGSVTAASPAIGAASTAKQWGSAVLISAQRQVEFAFPTAGRVSFSRLAGNQALVEKMFPSSLANLLGTKQRLNLRNRL